MNEPDQELIWNEERKSWSPEPDRLYKGFGVYDGGAEIDSKVKEVYDQETGK